MSKPTDRIVLTFHSDPGHGWLQVPKALVPEHMKAKISRFSYQDKNYFYLEEDCDAAPVLQFLKDSSGYPIDVRVQDYNAEAPIRNYQSVK